MKSSKKKSAPFNTLVIAIAGCSRMDRAEFNRNLLKLFENEHIRVHHHQSAKSAGLTEKSVLDWKFGSIDGNKNGMLDKNEYRELKRLIKKVG